MMGTNQNNKVANEANMENTQVQAQEQQAVENQQPVAAPQPEEKKEGFMKRAWNKVKKPLAIGGGLLAAFGLGVATDHFVINKTDSSQGETATGADTTAESTEQ